MDNNDKDFNYVEQKIKPKNRKKLKKAAAIIALTIVAAVLFGFLSRLVFVASEGAVNKILGITPTPSPTPVESTNNRNPVTFGSTPTPTSVQATPTPSPTPVPSPTTVPVTLDPTDEPSPTPTEAPTMTPTPVPEPDDKPTATPAAEDPIAVYLKMISQMRDLAGQASESLVRVYAVTSGVNWMDESIETRTERTGILVADNGVELLILAEYSALSAADRIEVEFRDGSISEGIIYSADPDTGLAVIGVELTNISASTAAACKYVSLGDSDKVAEGEPVIALGRPNGYYGAVEFGFVSHTGLAKYFIDGVNCGFTTDIVSGENADGIVIDLEGKLVGLIVSEPEGGNITLSAVYINSVKTLLLKLVNANPIPYFGVRAENVPADILKGMGLENGIYVNEVIAASPAADAGVKKGDVIVGIDDITIGSVTDFYEYIFSLEEGSTVRLDIYHSGMRDEPAEEISAVLSVK